MQLGSVRARARPTHTHSHTHNTQNWGHTRFFPLGYAGPQACFSTCKLPQICCHKAAFHLSVVANLLPQGSFPLVSCQKCVATRQLSTWQLSQFRYQKLVSPHLLPQISCHISVATRQLFINLYFNKSMTSFLFSSVIFSRSLISTIVATSQLPHASMSPLPLSWCHKPSGI